MPAEVFLVFIASCIGLWLIQLATERIDRRRIGRGTVMERYRSHLILVKAHREPDTDDWRASVHVQFNEEAFETFSYPDRLLTFPQRQPPRNRPSKKLDSGLIGFVKPKYSGGRLTVWRAVPFGLEWPAANHDSASDIGGV